MALENDAKSVEFLLNHGNSGNLMEYARTLNDTQLSWKTIQSGANTELKDADGRTALHVAAWQGYTDIVQVIRKTQNDQHVKRKCK